MSISAVLVGQTVYNPYTTQIQDIKQAEPSSYNRTAASDTVQISNEAKQLSQNAPIADSRSASFDPKNPPLEACGMPSWLGQYFPEATHINLEKEDESIKLGKKYMDGTISNKEQILVNNYRALCLEKAQFRSEFDSELREYSAILDSAIAKAMETNGLSEEFSYYQQVTLDQTVSAEKVHQNFRENLANSPRAIELMKILGIDDTAIEGLSTNS